MSIEAIGYRDAYWFDPLTEADPLVRPDHDNRLVRPPRIGETLTLILSYRSWYAPTRDDLQQASLMVADVEAARRAVANDHLAQPVVPRPSFWAVWAHPLVEENGWFDLDKPEVPWEYFGQPVAAQPELVRQITLVRVEPIRAWVMLGDLTRPVRGDLTRPEGPRELRLGCVLRVADACPVWDAPRRLGAYLPPCAPLKSEADLHAELVAKYGADRVLPANRERYRYRDIEAICVWDMGYGTDYLRVASGGGWMQVLESIDFSCQRLLIGNQLVADSDNDDPT